MYCTKCASAPHLRWFSYNTTQQKKNANFRFINRRMEYIFSLSIQHDCCAIDSHTCEAGIVCRITHIESNQWEIIQTIKTKAFNHISWIFQFTSKIVKLNEYIFLLFSFRIPWYMAKTILQTWSMYIQVYATHTAFFI